MNTFEVDHLTLQAVKSRLEKSTPLMKLINRAGIPVEKGLDILRRLVSKRVGMHMSHHRSALYLLVFACASFAAQAAEPYSRQVAGVYTALRKEPDGVHGIQLDLTWKGNNYVAEVLCPRGENSQYKPESFERFDGSVKIDKREGSLYTVTFRGCTHQRTRFIGILDSLSGEIKGDEAGVKITLKRRKHAWRPDDPVLDE